MNNGACREWKNGSLNENIVCGRVDFWTDRKNAQIDKSEKKFEL